MVRDNLVLQHRMVAETEGKHSGRGHRRAYGWPLVFAALLQAVHSANRELLRAAQQRSRTKRTPGVAAGFVSQPLASDARTLRLA
jgi:hypothetical protein